MSELPADTLRLYQSLAEATAREAGTLARRRFLDRDFTVEAKGAQDFVSAVDRETEALIQSRLRRGAPSVAFIGEEGERRFEDIAWVVDPIDGTSNFVNGLAYWCVSIGLYAFGKAVVGVVYDPCAEELFSAASGQGATVNGRSIRVTGQTDITRATMAVGYSHGRSVQPHLDGIRRATEAGCAYRFPGAGALSLTHVAAGRFDAYWETRINAWDVMAGLCLVTEAGGEVNDFLAGDGLREGNAILATTPALTAQFRALTGFATP